MAAQGQARSEAENRFKTKQLIVRSGLGRRWKRSSPLRRQGRTALPVARFNNGTGTWATNRELKVVVVVITNPAEARQPYRTAATNTAMSIFGACTTSAWRTVLRSNRTARDWPKLNAMPTIPRSASPITMPWILTNLRAAELVFMPATVVVPSAGVLIERTCRRIDGSDAWRQVPLAELCAKGNPSNPMTLHKICPQTHPQRQFGDPGRVGMSWMVS